MLVLELTLERGAIEAAIGVLLAEGARELELFDDERPPTLAALFEEDDPARARARVTTALGSSGIVCSRIEAHASSQVESSDRWFVRPMRFGPLVIAPPGRGVSQSGAHLLAIESLGAGVFGSGAHATTALVLERIIELSPIESFLDVGTGSGILALAALALGAEHVLGTENDPAALALARKNAAANNFAARLELARELPERAQFTVIAANILAAALIKLAPELVRRLASGGTILLSGVRAAEVNEVARAYKNSGLRLGPTVERDGWHLLELTAAW